MSLLKLKQDILVDFRSSLGSPADICQSGTMQERAKKINSQVNSILASIRHKIALHSEKQIANLVLQYCYSVISIEYRHRVWPYEYMAFSRRIGELWEGFCSAAWDFPARSDLERITAPDFIDVRDAIFKRIQDNIGEHANREEIITDINTLLEIIGEVNMSEDEVFMLANVPHVVDFKSGFGSNEKGNMLRLKTVGQAYKLWNHNTELLLIVRQSVNNNYLNVLKRTSLWSVYTGDEAYSKIYSLTGADINRVRTQAINWLEDLPPDIIQYFKRQPTDLTSYLTW
jgi:hypothetical protein